MTSLLRTTKLPTITDTKTVPVHSPCYNDSGLNEDLLFPFIVDSKGILNIGVRSKQIWLLVRGVVLQMGVMILKRM